MKEREYSVIVKDLEKSQEYCLSNGFCLVSSSEQIRTIYKKPDKTMARITEEKNGEDVKIFLDFKEDKLTGNPLTIRRESKALLIEDIDATLSILDFLDYKKATVLHRNRWVYTKSEIVCEIDLYDNKEKTIVVSMEGEDYDGVDEFYKNFVEKVGGCEK